MARPPASFPSSAWPCPDCSPPPTPPVLQAQLPLSSGLAHAGPGLPLVEQETLLAVPPSLIRVVAWHPGELACQAHPSMPAPGPEGLRAAITLKVTSGRQPEARGAMRTDNSPAATAGAWPALPSGSPLLTSFSPHLAPHPLAWALAAPRPACADSPPGWAALVPPGTLQRHPGIEVCVQLLLHPVTRRPPSVWLPGSGPRRLTLTPVLSWHRTPCPLSPSGLCCPGQRSHLPQVPWITCFPGL